MRGNSRLSSPASYSSRITMIIAASRRYWLLVYNSGGDGFVIRDGPGAAISLTCGVGIDLGSLMERRLRSEGVKIRGDRSSGCSTGAKEGRTRFDLPDGSEICRSRKVNRKESARFGGLRDGETVGSKRGDSRNGRMVESWGRIC
jgi:hypothetical protein